MGDAGYAVFGDERAAAVATQTSVRDLVVIAWDGRSTPHDLVHFDRPPAFDLLTFDYAGNAASPAPRAERHYFRSCKTEGKGQVLQAVAEFLNGAGERYRYVGILDDDILIRVSDLNHLLHVARCFDLDAFAPALADDAFHSHVHTLRRGLRLLRPVPWIEVMMPFYKVELFEMAAPFFASSISSWGIDKYVVPMVQKLSGMERTAIVDGVLASHVRPVRSGAKVHSNGLDPFQEMKLVRDRCIAYLATNHPDLVASEWFDETFEALGRAARLKRRLRRWLHGEPNGAWYARAG